MRDLDAGGVTRLTQGLSKQTITFHPPGLWIFAWYNLGPHLSGSAIQR